MLVIVNADFQGPSPRPSRSGRGGGKNITPREHLRNTMCYLTKRNDERWTQQPEFAAKHPDFKPDAAKIYEHGLSGDWRQAWQQIESSTSEKVVYRYFDISPNSVLINTVPEEMWEQLTVDLAVDSLHTYCQKQHGNDDLKFVLMYHFATDKDGHPHPHAHLITEGSIYDEKKGERVPFALYPEHLAQLKQIHGEVFSRQLDEIVGPGVWRPLYERWQTEQEQSKLAANRAEIEALGSLFPEPFVPEIGQTIPPASVQNDIHTPNAASLEQEDFAPPRKTHVAQMGNHIWVSNQEGTAAGTWYRFRNSAGDAEMLQVVKLWTDANGKRQTIYNDLYRYDPEASPSDREGAVREWNEALGVRFEDTMASAGRLWQEYPEHYQSEFLGNGTPNPFPSIAEPEPEDQAIEAELELEDERDDFDIEL